MAAMPPMDFERYTNQRHEDSLMHVPGAIGTGIGAGDQSGQPAIEVFVEKLPPGASRRVERRRGSSGEGYRERRIRCLLSRIRPQGSNQCHLDELRSLLRRRYGCAAIDR